MTVAKVPKLNNLQGRTLAFMQELAQDDMLATDNPAGGRDVYAVAEQHGGQVHIGGQTVSSQFASGFMNENVWKALERKGPFPFDLTVLSEGLDFDTGLTANDCCAASGGTCC